jgi:uncharacterized protein (TIGR01777 family)
MKVLITGATGLVGTALIQSLQQDGHLVCRLLRKKPEEDRQLKQDCDIDWDPKSGTFGPAAENADAVVNLAGAAIADGRWSEERKAVLLSSRVETTRGLIAGMEKMSPRPKVLVSASAVGFYGNRGDELLTETSSPRPEFLSRLAEEWEAEAAQAQSLGVRTVIARFGIILAKHGGALKPMMVPFKIGVGGKLGTGKQWMSWVALEDVVRILRFALDTEIIQGPINVVAPQPVTNAEFTKVLADTMHRPAFFTVPTFALHALLGEMADEMLLAGQRAIPESLQKHGYQFAHTNLHSALTAILQKN